ncbi:hypothetical protein KHP57_02170 [Algiphilus sp. NNCM1]|jgi:hypothetical protein|uniref:hypothetical protein n=1 Tax=Algiphilus sp. TaxID=1872431 RepID=UPI001CA74439|nr:hypothetical protein [Algiphilus sp.]MBY8964496.1 hypothetical protein [Algiphilus acroporae]MCI5103179.1 hypothetical protein [Algiphilus sp.]
MPRKRQPSAFSPPTPSDREASAANSTSSETAFDALYARIAAPASRVAADAVFEATEEDLGRHHRPGDTEVPT